MQQSISSTWAFKCTIKKLRNHLFYHNKVMFLYQMEVKPEKIILSYSREGI